MNSDVKMIDKKEFDTLKEEHNKVAGWTEFFNSKIHELEGKIKDLENNQEARIEKEKILGRTVLKLIRENEEIKRHLKITEVETSKDMKRRKR